MKKFKNCLIALTLALVLVISPTTQSFAAEELPTEAVYDMEKGGTQTFTIRNSEGGIDTVTITEIESGNGRVANGEYLVGYHNTGVWIADFIIAVSSNQIYNAHTPRISKLAGEIRFPALTRPSVTHAMLSFIFAYNGINYSTGVNAKIINGEIVVTKR